MALHTPFSGIDGLAISVQHRVTAFFDGGGGPGTDRGHELFGRDVGVERHMLRFGVAELEMGLVNGLASWVIRSQRGIKG